MINFVIFTSYQILVKGKAIPLQARIRLEVFRRLKLPEFMTVSTLRW